MSVLSIRLNKNEEEMLKTLSAYYEEDKSTLIKHSLQEMYEDLIDKEEIENFEKREKKGKVTFYTSDEMRENL